MSTAAEQLASSPDGAPDVAAIDRVFKAQQQQAIAWRASTAAERIERLQRLLTMMETYADRIREAAHADFRKPEAEVDLTEIMPVISEARHAIKKTKKWMKNQHVMPTQLTFGTRSWIKYEPKGVSLIISPWNYPVNLTFGPLASALAAGCTAILKPSEMTPNLSALMREMVQATFAPNEVALFEGDARTSQALLSLPFDHIFFTGSPAIGKIVMKAAAEHLTSVTLELGGKSPTLIDESADLKRAAQSLIWGKFTNNGQTCIAPDLIYVHESVKDDFVTACKEQLDTFYGSDVSQSPDYCRIVNNRHHGRLQGLLDDARSSGANVITGGDSDGEQNYIAPTLIDNVAPTSKIMEEEIFGPLLPILPVRSMDEAIADINTRPKPLALYVFAKDKRVINHVMANTTAGGTCINTSVVQYLHGNLPFGGVNNSGIGNAHGHFGFKAFSHERAVVKDVFSQTKMFNPPYTDFVKKMIKLTMKYFA